MAYIYILSNRRRTSFYIGVTNNSQRRIYEHKVNKVAGYSNKYLLKELVYFEEYDSIKDAIKREKQLKNWHRQWKINLIKFKNPQLIDLANNW